MDSLVQAFLDEISLPTSKNHSILNLLPSTGVKHICSDDTTICEYKIPSTLIDFLDAYFCSELFEEDKSLCFSEEDKNESDFKFIFQYLQDYTYVLLTTYFLSYNLPVSHLKLLKDFIVCKEKSEHRFLFDSSHIYVKLFIPLEDCLISFTYKNLSDNNLILKKSKLYVIPYGLSTSIESIKHKHIVFDVCL